MADPIRIHFTFIGRTKTLTDARGKWRTSIARDPYDGELMLGFEGLDGDKPTQRYHGGRDGAVCCHILEHYDFWNQRYGMSLKPGAVGENWTLINADEDSICVGDIYGVGGAIVQVSGPRIPCANQERHVGKEGWVKMTLDELRPGLYLRVLTPGIVKTGNEWILEDRPNAGYSLTTFNRCFFHKLDPELARRFIEMPGLSDYFKEKLESRIRGDSE
jgi:MOSC domain-containing protein YiiM